MSTTTEGNRSPDITYGGSALASSTTYYWRIKFWDDDDAEGDWSTTTASFSLAEEGTSGGTTTVTIYPESGDGYVYYNLGYTWSAAHDASIGLGSSDSASSASVNVGKSGFWYEISRGFIPFDTSSIPANATVTAATLHVYVNSKQNDDNDGSDYVTVIESTTGSTASLNTLDYDECGATDNPTEGIDTGDRKDISSISTGQYMSFELNATGTSWINTGSSGTTKLCLREGHDTTDSAFSGSSGEYNEIVFATVEATGTSTDPYLEVTYIGGTSSTSSNPNAPTAPTDLETEGQTNPTAIVDTTPEFSAIYNDPNDSDVAPHYQIQVSTSSSDWTNPKWDSDKSSFTVAANEGSRSELVSYSGSTLATSTTYYWRIKFWDWDGNEGEWSTSTATFKLSAGPIAIGLIEERTYTYDKVGNITQIVDTSDTGSRATTSYGYDDLYRLTSASTTDATSTSYVRTFEYTAIGNIASSSDTGVYTYAGDTLTSESYKWANPHAVTSIKLHGETTGAGQTYDKNGNVSTGGLDWANGNSYTWDHKNRLIEAQSPEGFTMGSYFDYEGTRVILRTGSTEEWHYPSKYYSLRYDTAPYTPVEARKSIYAGDKLVATVQGTSTDALVFYNHLDHLGSTRAVTEYDGDTVEVQDYYPFGGTRVRDQYAEFGPKTKFSSHEWDETVGVYYMGARYYEPEVKRFLSQDPEFLRVGDDGSKNTDILRDPQRMNSYTYVGNNPLAYVDPFGEDYFHFANGEVVHQGTGEAHRYESLDRQILDNNAASVKQTDSSLKNAGRAIKWGNNVRFWGKWDYKNLDDGRDDGYIFEGQIVTPEEFGNINFGYTGTALGLSRQTIHGGGGAAQLVSDGLLSEKEVFWWSCLYAYCDHADDYLMIQRGINAYIATLSRAESKKESKSGGGCLNCGQQSSVGTRSSSNSHWSSAYERYARRVGLLQ